VLQQQTSLRCAAQEASPAAVQCQGAHDPGGQSL
jgi:hypothetical protein